jgi:hypothetical protein
MLRFWRLSVRRYCIIPQTDSIHVAPPPPPSAPIASESQISSKSAIQSHPRGPFFAIGDSPAPLSDHPIPPLPLFLVQLIEKRVKVCICHCATRSSSRSSGNSRNWCGSDGNRHGQQVVEGCGGALYHGDGFSKGIDIRSRDWRDRLLGREGVKVGMSCGWGVGYMWSDL